MSAASISVEVSEGEVVEVTVVRRRIEQRTEGPGLARLTLDAAGEPQGEWAEVIDLAERRAG